MSLSSSKTSGSVDTKNSSININPPLAKATAIDLGLIEYDRALDIQMKWVEKVAASPEKAALIYCTHPEIVTLGRKTQSDDVFAWDGPTREVARGGRATYHGPSQLIMYPIVCLDSLPVPRDIGWFLRSLEDAVIATLAEYGVTGKGKSHLRDLSDTGVWIGERKIASLGIGVRQWVSYHGVAINLDRDQLAFRGMNPCGFKRDVMISLEEILGQPINHARFQSRLENHFCRIFNLAK